MNAAQRKTAISWRVMLALGQKLPLPQPPVMHLFASSLIQRAAQWLQGTSVNRGVVHAGGVTPLVARIKIAISALVTATSGQ